MLEELVGDQSLAKFKDEYEKLHRALRKSHDNEKRLIKKCRELNSEIVSNAAKVGHYPFPCPYPYPNATYLKPIPVRISRCKPRSSSARRTRARSRR